MLRIINVITSNDKKCSSLLLVGIRLIRYTHIPVVTREKNKMWPSVLCGEPPRREHISHLVDPQKSHTSMLDKV